jgi:hypothetical protein
MPLLNGAEIVVISLAAACLILSAAVVALAARVARLARLVSVATAPGEAAPAAALARDLRTVSEQVSRVETGLMELRGFVQSCIRHVGVVRYDAFRDMGGHMSFSLALLDGRQNGVVLSVLNGRDGSRGYAKAVTGGRSTSPLSEEEQEALSQALDLARMK